MTDTPITAALLPKAQQRGLIKLLKRDRIDECETSVEVIWPHKRGMDSTRVSQETAREIDRMVQS
jgi:hypothetical protein